MIATIRASKRIALGGAFAFALVILCLLAVKDLNDKLGVMTASNAGKEDFQKPYLMENFEF